MERKIQNISELEAILSNKDTTAKGVSQFISNFKIGALLKPFDALKSKGFPVSMLIVTLCLYRIKGLSIWAMQQSGCNNLFPGDENCFYRLLNNCMMNWRKLLLSFASQFVVTAMEKGDRCTNTRCFVLDDSDLEKTGRKIEFIGKIFNHVTRRYVLGFKLLVLGYWDGKSLVPCDFSMHREKGKSGNYGMSKKERRLQFRKKRGDKAPSSERVKELDAKKTKVAVSMLRRTIKKGLSASYVLMDSWFTNDYIIKSVRSMGKGAMHVLGMAKMDKRKYFLDKRELNSRQIITKYERKRKKHSRKHNSSYIPIVAEYKGEKVKLFFIRYNNSKNWTVLLTTDLTLKFTQALELYQIRWSIEVLFKECKQYLGLGNCQHTDFDGQVADTTLVFITYTILSLQKRFESYETLGGVFRESQQKLLELTLWERILKIFIKMLRQLSEIISIDLEETLERVMQNDKVGKQIIRILHNLNENDGDLAKNAA